MRRRCLSHHFAPFLWQMIPGFLRDASWFKVRWRLEMRRSPLDGKQLHVVPVKVLLRRRLQRAGEKATFPKALIRRNLARYVKTIMQGMAVQSAGGACSSGERRSGSLGAASRLSSASRRLKKANSRVVRHSYLVDRRSKNISDAIATYCVAGAEMKVSLVNPRRQFLRRERSLPCAMRARRRPSGSAC